MTADCPSKMSILREMMPLLTGQMPLMVQAESCKAAGDLEGAATHFRQLIQLLRSQLSLAELNNRCYPDSPYELQSIVGSLMNNQLMLADMLEGLGDLAQAEALRNAAVATAEQYQPGSGSAERHRQRAQSLLAQSRYPEALVALFDALAAFRQKGEVLQIAKVSANIAEVLEWLGDLDRAGSEAKRAAALLDDLLHGRVPADRDILVALSNSDWQGAEQAAALWALWCDLEQLSARIDRRQHRWDAAAAGFQQVRPHIPSLGQPGIDFQLAAIEVERGHAENGLALIDLLMPRFTGLLRPKLGVLQGLKAETLLALDRPDEALVWARDSMLELQQFHDQDALWKAQWRSARCLDALGETESALDHYLLAARTIDDLRKAPLGYRLDSTYMADKRPLFDAAIELAARLGRADDGCLLIELVKSRALTATLMLPRANIDARSTELGNRIDALSQRIDALEYSMHRGGDLVEQARQHSGLLQQRAQLLEEARFSDPRWRALSQPQPFDLSALRALLGKNRQAAISLYLVDDRLVAVLIDGQGSAIASKLLASATLSALEGYAANLQAARPDPKQYDPAGSPALDALNLLPESMLDRATNAPGGVIMVPHGLLHLLPWPGLRHPDGRRLFEVVAIAVLPNLSSLSALQHELADRPPYGALIGAPQYPQGSGLQPLPYAQVELELLQTLYQEAGRELAPAAFGRNATTGRLEQLCAATPARRPALLHVACHASFEAGEPLNAGLLLANGRFDAAELARLHLPFDEVVLSGCSTGYRPTTVGTLALAGDDVLGLPAALLEAGARALLVSIPPAQDAAAMTFMENYHEHRGAGNSPMRSLCLTQRHMLELGRYDPSLWIGFTLYGCN